MKAAHHHHTAARGLHLFHGVIYTSGLLLVHVADAQDAWPGDNSTAMRPQYITQEQQLRHPSPRTQKEARHRTEQPQLHTGEY
jgi:hypothetical protein